jgi:hypothetical protein
MNKVFTIFMLILSGASPVFAQDSIKARVILIGDAGEMDEQQKLVIPDAASRILLNKTTVFYLGDNIYPHGMGLPGSSEEDLTKQILRSQYEPMRAGGASVYFIPGNHDWDRMGPEGLAKIKAQWKFINDQHDPLLAVIPANGCADPVAIPVGDSLAVLAMDSEWWLFPFDKKNPEAECNSLTPRDVTRALRVMRYQNRNKVILLATHHPFQSYGTHGGYFPLKDHLFPLTAVNKNLYIPIPVVGSIYPLYRKVFPNEEDLRNPLYKGMIRDVDKVFEGFPNMIHVSGHEHGLQYIVDLDTKQIQIVSGGGAKENHTIKGKHSLFGVASQGYVVADLLPGNDVRFTYYVYHDGRIQQDFQHTVKYTPVAPLKDTISYGNAKVDSLTMVAHAAYADRKAFSRLFFGENYRKEWSMPVKLPVIRVSAIDGGLVPEQLGGGFQSTSLRLKGKDGKEYALRTVEKSPDLVVPFQFQGTFVREFLDDATSAQHPYSALVVAPVASAIHVPHSTPIIGAVVADENLGIYQSLFDNKVCLLEEREPLGKSDNTIKALKELQQDHDNTYDGRNFLKARMLDVLFADWDRHADQWRFYNRSEKGQPKNYIAIPRDRDMVFNITEGILPTIAKRMFLLPRVYGFKGNLIPGSRYYLYKTVFLAAHPASQISHDDWTTLSNEFKTQVTDSVLEESLQQLPADIYPLRHDKLLAALKERRDEMPEAMERYYHFSNSIVDIHTSNKNEFISVKDDRNENGSIVTILKRSNDGSLGDTLVYKTYPHAVTKELRIFVGKGNDSVVVDNKTSGVKLRIIGDKGNKAYDIVNSKKHIKLYDKEAERYYGKINKLNKHLNDDSLNTAFTPVNLYNTTIPLVNVAYNPDDGFFLGAGFKHIQQRGFRQYPYSSLQSLMVTHSFNSQAFSAKYNGEWIKAIGNADVTVQADIKAPDNTQNYFGRGNETPFDKTGDFKRYYRTRFNLMDFNAMLRWRGQKGSAFSIGPALEYYHLDSSSNTGRFIENTANIGTYDGGSYSSDKTHIGFAANYTLDQRNNKILPTWGVYVKVDAQGFAGANAKSESFLRIVPELALYKSLNARQTIVFTDRIGGGISVGKTGFYQSMFLGGEGNLMGYRQYRFAGQHSIYNNMEVRIGLANFGNYLFKGQFGIIGFYDIGRVFVSNEDSQKWHNGFGGGLYITPASMAVFRINIAVSEESVYPSFGMGFRF